nr:Gag-Pol polyprotein [Tanacetum cinerariifolium]
MESIHVNFDELPQVVSAHNSSDPAPTCQTMASDQNSSDPAPECQKMALEHNSLSPRRKCQENISHGDKTVTTSNELDLLFSLMFDELLNGSSKVVSKSSTVSTANATNECQQLTTPLNNHTTPEPTCQSPSIAPTVIPSENINQAEPHAENDQVADDEFINIFSTPVQDQGETSLRHVFSSNMHTFYQRYPSEHRWTKDHPLGQVIGNPSQSIRTRRQLESDAEMCMFALIVSRTEPKNIKEAMTDSAWIESMQEELHQFDRLDTMVLEHASLSPGRNCQKNVSHRDKTGTTSNELDLLLSPMFDELLNGSTKVVSKSSAVSAADALNQRQQPTTPLNTHTTPVPTCQNPPITTVISSENINQAEPHAQNAQRWTKDHPLEQVLGNPSQSVRTRRQLESDAEMCMFALTVSRTEPKNIKEAMADST